MAKILYERFIAIYGHEPSLREILDTPTEDFRSIGFSNAKAGYVHNVCLFFQENKLTDKIITALDDEAVISLLTQIKGIGRWTVEMLLMFTLGREDVFALDDLGLQQRMTKLYALRGDKKIIRKKMEKISSPWSPYRTYACRYLWNWEEK